MSLISISSIEITAGIVSDGRIYQRENDPYWQAAKEIYKVQIALQAVNEDCKMEYRSEVSS